MDSHSWAQDHTMNDLENRHDVGRGRDPTGHVQWHGRDEEGPPL